MQANAPPANVHLLADQYNLGAPIKMHRRPIPLPLTLASLVGGLLCLIFAGGLLGYILLSAQRFSVSGLILGIFALGVGMVLLVSSISRLNYWRFCAWECDAGFLEFDGRGALNAALRWDQIQTVWHRVKVSTSRTGTGYEHIYSVQKPDGKEVTLNYPDLWQHIESEFAHLHLPQALATVQAGQAVSFGGVVVSAQGIASGSVIYYYQNRTMPNTKSSWQIAWQAIPSITVTGGMIEFTPPERGLVSYTPPIFARLSDVPNLCLLRALVLALTNGRVRWIEQPRRGSVENSSPTVR